MKAGSRRRAERELTQRQRYWLRHIRAAERKNEPLTVYAEQRGLSVSSLYEAKHQLRKDGFIEAASESRKPERATPEFVRVSIREPVPSAKRAVLRVRLGSGAVLEWSDALQGEALRELVGMLS
jgi:hypothetical protein